MSNPLFNQLGNNTQYADIISQFKDFKKTINGNPKEIVMNMLSSGKISQAQLNQAQAMANQLKGILK